MASAAPDRDVPSVAMVMCLNAVALAGILISQRHFRNQFTVFATDLPLQTQIAIGYIPPFIIAGCLILGLITTSPPFARFRALWQKLSFVTSILVIGHHTIAMSLAYVTGPVDLSLILPESCTLNSTLALVVMPHSFGYCVQTFWNSTQQSSFSLVG